jgi:UDPglucose--hexose-1-phosphate uridylyltransferase
MNGILDRPPYHLLVYTAPFRHGEGFRWRIEVVPRLARIAGFELATGVFVNQTAPEKAAAAYRESLVGTASSLQGRKKSPHIDG